MDQQHNNMTPPMEGEPQQPPMQQQAAPQQDMPTPNSIEKSGGMGPFIGIVIIVALLILGGLYFWGAQLSRDKPNTIETAVIEPSNSDITEEGDEPEAIESDLDDFNSVEFEAQLEADLKALEADL